MFFITLSVSAFCVDSSFVEKKTVDTISSINVLHQDCIAAKSSESVISAMQRNDGLFIGNRKTDNMFDNGLNNAVFGNSNQLEDLLAYIYNQSFLHNKSKVHFSVILSEIQPNAP